MLAMSLYAFIATGLVFAIGQAVIRRIKHTPQTRTEPALLQLMVLLVAVSLIYPASLAMKHESVHPIPMVVGSVITVAGMSLSFYAQWVLGKYWVGGVGLHKKHQLITTGPYRYIRHPLYTGMLVMGIGLAVFGWNLVFGLMTILWMGSYAFRAPFEDVLLSKRFRKSYDRYAATTGALVPKIRR